MIWTLSWSGTCDTDVLDVGYEIAERVCMAVKAFALDGVGELEPVPTSGDDGSLWTIKASGGFALIQVEASTRTIHVLRVQANSPRHPAVRLL